MLDDGSCVRLRPERKNDVWIYDFVAARTDDGRAFRMLDILEEYTSECLDITVEGKITSHQIIERLSHLFITKVASRYVETPLSPENDKILIYHDASYPSHLFLPVIPYVPESRPIEAPLSDAVPDAPRFTTK